MVYVCLIAGQAAQKRLLISIVAAHLTAACGTCSSGVIECCCVSVPVLTFKDLCLQAYNLALARYTRLVRQLLPPFGGYECKEPEPGKFTLAFP